LQSTIAAREAALQEVITARAINAVNLANLEELKSRAARTQSAAFSANLRVAAEERVIVANSASITSSNALLNAELRLSASATLLAEQKAASVVATNAHATAKSREAVATGVLSVANKGLTVSATIATRSTRALTASLAFLGGPIGAAVIAATAIFLYTSRVDDAGVSSSLTASEVEKLSKSFNGLSDNLKRTKISEINKEMALIRAELISSGKAVEFFKNQAKGLIGKERTDVLSMIKGHEAAVIDLNRQLDLLSQKQGILFPDPSKGFTDRTGEDSKKETKQSPFSLRLSQETEALKIELALRQQVAEGFLSQADATLTARFISDQSRRDLAFQIELEKLGENETQRNELIASFRDQQLAAAQLYEDSLTGIEQKGSDERIAMDDREFQSKIQLTQGIVGLMQVFAGKSKKASKALMLIQGALSAFQIYAATEAAAALALAQPPGPPATIPFAAAISASGKLRAGAVLAGAAVGAFSGGGGGGGGFIRPQSTATQPTITQDFQANEVTESTALTELANELRNRDPDEMLSVNFVRRLVASVDDARGTGQI